MPGFGSFRKVDNAIHRLKKESVIVFFLHSSLDSNSLSGLPYPPFGKAGLGARFSMVSKSFWHSESMSIVLKSMITELF